MEIRRAEEQTTSRWSGGTTTQLAIWPPEAKYADRNFLWRLSTATVDDPDSTFTSLPDYNRFLAVRQGMMRMKHGSGDNWIVMVPGRIDFFDGGVETVSHGQVTDFNLMVRKEEGDGAAQYHVLKADREYRLGELFRIREAVSDVREDLCAKKAHFFGLYLSGGSDVELTTEQGETCLHSGDLVIWMPGEEWEDVRVKGTGETELYAVWIEQE